MSEKFTADLDFADSKEAIFTIRINTDEGEIIAKGQFLYKNKTSLRVRWLDGKKHDVDEETKEEIKEECRQKAIKALFK